MKDFCSRFHRRYSDDCTFKKARPIVTNRRAFSHGSENPRLRRSAGVCTPPDLFSQLSHFLSFRKVSTFAKDKQKTSKRHKKAAFLILLYLKDGFDTLFDCGENTDNF